MSFREHRAKDGWSDWQLARLAVDIRSMACYGGTLKAGVEPRLRKEFTADELLRADAYLAASLPDAGRLTAIESRLDPVADDDTGWLTEKLRIAWEGLDDRTAGLRQVCSRCPLPRQPARVPGHLPKPRHRLRGRPVRHTSRRPLIEGDWIRGITIRQP
ncbi:hypothetical protein [Streptomyces sp. NPDC102437]|uniref:hypothetical protein n=1 Tax=Streptomyces sp. NPDC102437 TaxID=3366175 RepID=UPI0038181228